MAVEGSRSLLSRLEALGYEAYFRLFGALPLDRASDVGAALFKALGPLLPVHQVARRNIELVFPELGEPERRALLSGMWDNLGRTFAEFPHLHRMPAYGEGSRITVEGVHLLDRLIADKQAAVFVTGHFANWEVMATAIVQRGVPCQITYRPANNAFVDARIVAQREAYGAKTQAAKGRAGGMGLLRALAQGETVALLNDQKYAEGVAAPFFGRIVMTADGPARLARRFGCPLIPISVRRLKGARFVVRFHEPLAQSAHPDEEVAIAETVAAINRFVEGVILAAPEQWFWVHRRWPKEVYRDPAPPAPASASDSAADARGSKASADSGSI